MGGELQRLQVRVRPGTGLAVLLLSTITVLPKPVSAHADTEWQAAHEAEIDRGMVDWIAGLPSVGPLPKRLGCSPPVSSVSWQDYAGVPRNQGNCGSCYVFGTVGLLEVQRAVDCCDDNFRAEGRCLCDVGVPGCVAGALRDASTACPWSAEPGQLHLAAQVPLECSQEGYDEGCLEGEAWKVGEFLAAVGTTYEAIERYEFPPGDRTAFTRFGYGRYDPPFPNICPLLDRAPYNGVCDLEDRVAGAPTEYPPLDFFRFSPVNPGSGDPTAFYNMVGAGLSFDNPRPLLEKLCEGYVIGLQVPAHTVIIVGYTGYDPARLDGLTLVVRDSAGDFAGELQRERHDAASSRYWSSVREDRVFLAAGTTVARGCPDDWLTNPARDADGDTILNLDDVCLYEWNTPQVDSGGRARAAGPDDYEDWWP